MYGALNCHNVAEHTKLHLWLLRFNVAFIDNSGCFKKKLYNGIANVTVWRVLRKRLYLSIVQQASGEYTITPEDGRVRLKHVDE
jgi:hypothetical protein